MTYLYKIAFLKNDRCRKLDFFSWRDRWLSVEDALTNFRLEHPEPAVPISIQFDGHFLWTAKDEPQTEFQQEHDKMIDELLVDEDAIKANISCHYCGGVDAHLPNCKGGYGL